MTLSNNTTEKLWWQYLFIYPRGMLCLFAHEQLPSIRNNGIMPSVWLSIKYVRLYRFVQGTSQSLFQSEWKYFLFSTETKSHMNNKEKKDITYIRQWLRRIISTVSILNMNVVSISEWFFGKKKRHFGGGNTIKLNKNHNNTNKRQIEQWWSDLIFFGSGFWIFIVHHQVQSLSFFLFVFWFLFFFLPSLQWVSFVHFLWNWLLSYFLLFFLRWYGYTLRFHRT